ncbi:hypothetical protein KUTeg_004909 [Tegillarca granosa]|uniref:Macro domain-containing protein n=1 Tax=Tegillarca granosa TaxID=220873 RepID=A0ABQ9FL45_TEGGR|nr:hypothetical protein KUTeg_004909 [Tegillarca granosa]
MKNSKRQAWHVLQRSGPAIQNKCDIYIKRNGSLKEGQLYVSSEGAENLMCKLIVFVAGPMYTGKRISEEETILKELILKSLKECEKRNLHSVVFPAICTGYNRFPVAEATRVIALAIQNYFQNNFRSCIKKVYLCDTDKQKVQSFELALQSVFGVANCMREQRSNQEHKVKRRNSSTTLQSRMHHSSYETWRGDRDCRGKMGDFVNVTVGKLDLKVFHGDITCAKADVIVISARPDMDLSKGFLSNKVKQKGGDVIQQELNSQRSLMKSEGIVVTTSGKLPCKYLVHIDISGTELPEHWKTKFINLLKKTEELEMQSVAIPALGMRDEKGIGIVAKELFQALTEHKNPKFLQEVHMVFYEADMKHNFLEEIQERIRLKDNPAKRLFRQFSCRLLVPFSNEHRSPVPDETLTITVDSETDKSNTEAIRMIDAEIKKNLATTLIENNIVKELSPLQQKSILSIPEYICVEVTLNIKSGKITLLGCEEDVKKAQEDVEMVIRQAERYKKDFEKFVPRQYKK